MKYQVINLAEDDLLSIVEYIAFHDCPENAFYVYEKLKESLCSLESFPQKGHIPKECDDADSELLEIHFSVYRIIYRISNSEVVILAIIDGRRDISEQFFGDI